MRSQNIKIVLAYWVFLNPEFLDTAKATMRKHTPARFWRTSWLWRPARRSDSSQARFLLKVLGARAVRIIEQKAGYMVTLSPGWRTVSSRALPQEILEDHQPRHHGAIPQLLVPIWAPFHQGGWCRYTIHPGEAVPESARVAVV